MAENSKISMYEYLASNVPADVHFVMNSYGHYQKAQNEEELSHQQRDFVRKFGEKGLKALAEIHPDKPLMNKEDCKNCSDKDNYVALLKNQSSQQHAYFNAVGMATNPSSSQSDKIIDRISTNNIMFSAIILLGVAYFTKKS